MASFSDIFKVYFTFFAISMNIFSKSNVGNSFKSLSGIVLIR